MPPAQLSDLRLLAALSGRWLLALEPVGRFHALAGRLLAAVRGRLFAALAGRLLATLAGRLLAALAGREIVFALLAAAAEAGRCERAVLCLLRKLGGVCRPYALLLLRPSILALVGLLPPSNRLEMQGSVASTHRMRVGGGW